MAANPRHVLGGRWSEKDVAQCRDRQLAAKAIFGRLVKLLRGEILHWAPPGLRADVTSGRVEVRFVTTADGTYFRVDLPHGAGRVMSGFLYPKPPGKYVDGLLHVGTWVRGWEAELF